MAWNGTRLAAPLLGASLVLMLAGAAPATAKDLKFAVGFPPGSAPAIGMEKYAEHVQKGSDGALKTRVFTLSLLNLKETPPGVRDGIADVGFVLTPYYPQEFAHSNLIADLSMLATTGTPTAFEGGAFSGAAAEYIFFKCPECLEEYKQQNQVYLGHAASSIYILQCTQPVTALGDLKGKRLRSGAANFARWAESFGAVAVSLPGNEIYDALSQGAVDCAMLSAPELTNLQTIDVVKHLTLKVPGGVFGGTAVSNVNRDTWQDLTPEQRKIFYMGAALNAAYTNWGYKELADTNIAASKAKGIGIHEPRDALLKSSFDFVDKDMVVIAEQYAKNYGVQRAGQMIEEFRPLMEKWKELVAGVKDRDQLARLYYDELFSKLSDDYGM